MLISLAAILLGVICNYAVFKFIVFNYTSCCAIDDYIYRYVVKDNKRKDGDGKNFAEPGESLFN